MKDSATGTYEGYVLEDGEGKFIQVDQDMFGVEVYTTDDPLTADMYHDDVMVDNAINFIRSEAKHFNSSLEKVRIKISWELDKK